MGIFAKFRFWDYRWYQQAADEIDAWHFRPEVVEALGTIEKALPAAVVKRLLGLTEYLYTYCLKKYGAAFVKATIARIVEYLTVLVGGLKKGDE